MKQQYICEGFDEIRCYNKERSSYCLIRYRHFKKEMEYIQDRSSSFGNPVCEKRIVKWVTKFEYLMLKKLREK